MSCPRTYEKHIETEDSNLRELSIAYIARAQRKDGQVQVGPEGDSVGEEFGLNLGGTGLGEVRQASQMEVAAKTKAWITQNRSNGIN